MTQTASRAILPSPTGMSGFALKPILGALPPERDEGSAIVETAISFLLLCILLFCFMEICLAVYSHGLISELACEGTRYAMFRGASCPNSTAPTCEVTAAQVNAYVQAISLPNLGGGTISVNTTYPDGNENVGSRVKVQVSYNFPITMPLVPQNAIAMSTASTAYIIQ